MVWLPIALNIPIYRYDLLLVDEAQDLNRAQQELALKAAHRMVLIGDPKQAVYGFVGADSKSMERMHIILGGNVGEPAHGQRGCVVLPLMVTRRCGRAIVREAQKIVPDFEAHESNGPGVVEHWSFKDSSLLVPWYEKVQDGDLIICRCNAPLIQQCFRFLRQNRKAFIQGRDIGAGLIRTIKKLKPISVVDLFAKLEEWYLLECQKENARVHPSVARLIALSDKKGCIQAMCEGMPTIDEVIANINSMFHDDKRGVGIELSSIHQAKGRERKRVFFLMPEHASCPHPLAKTLTQKESERNLLYVGITRAIEELYFVS